MQLKRNIIFCFLLSINICRAEYIDSLKLALKNAKHDTARSTILNRLIESESNDDVWIEYVRQVEKICETNLTAYPAGHPMHIFFKSSLASAIYNTGYYQQGKGNIPEALKHYREALKMHNESGNKKEIANCLNSLGIIYLNQGNIPQSLEFFHRSIKIQEEIGDKEGLAYSLNNIGYIFKNQGDTQKALDYYLKSLKIQEEAGDKEGVARMYGNIGAIYGDMDDHEKALTYYKKSLVINEQLGYKKGISQSINNIAYIFYLRRDIPKALENFNQSLKIREEIDDKEGIFHTCLDISKTYVLAKKYSNAREFSLKALKISKELGYPEYINLSAGILKKIYLGLNDPGKALEMFELHIKMRDSVNNLETRKASVRKQAQMDYEKKETELKAIAKAEQEKIQLKADADKKHQNIIIYSVVGGLLLVTLFLVFVFRSLQQNKRSHKIISAQKKEVEVQKHMVDEKQKEIVDSINYAKRIQYSLLAPHELLKKYLPEHFVLFKPKDIVSGDFYWATSLSPKTSSKQRAAEASVFYLAVCDSTGHGVPGAFMSLLNIGFLSEAINEKEIEQPNEILDFVRERLINTISKEGKQDGFDGILLKLEIKNNEMQIEYSAANNAPLIIEDGKALSLDADKMPVGIGERKENFKLFTIPNTKNRMLYLYTDGYADQFGGPKGKKFKYKQLNELLLDISTLPVDEQKQTLDKAFEKWKRDLEQVDDVCIIGIRM